MLNEAVMPLVRCSRDFRVVLALVAASAVLRGLAWVAALPAWQGPDEPAHYAYVERLADGGFPPLQRGRAADSPALAASLAATASEEFRLGAPARPLSQGLREALPHEPSGLSTVGHAARGATGYPPAYYALAVPLYALPGLETATARLFAVRVVSALAVGALVVLTALFVRELTGRDGLALAAGALVSLPPLVGQASGIANPDMLLAAGVAGLAWSGFRLARMPGNGGARLHAASWFALVALTKPVGIGLAGVTLLACLAAARPHLRRRAVLALAGAVGLALAAGAATAAASHETRSTLAFSARYLWDFYRPGVLDPGAVRPSRAWEVWVESGVGGFGWLSVWLQPSAYRLALATVALALAVIVVGVVRDRRALPVVAAFAAAVAVYVLGLHAVELHELLEQEPPLLQGRYLIPVAPLAVGALAVAAAALPRRALLGAMTVICLAWSLLAALALDAVVAYFAS